MSTPVDPPQSIAALTKKFRTLGRIPFLRPVCTTIIQRAESYAGITDAIQNESNGPVRSYLCDVCDKLNLSVDSFVVRPGQVEFESGIRRYLGRLSQIRRKPFCPVCRLVLEIADRPSDQRSPSHTISDEPTVYGKWVTDGQDLVQDPSQPEKYTYQPRTRRLMIYSDPQAFKDGYIVLLADDAPIREFLGRKVISHDLLDSELVKSWLNTCERKHGQICEEPLVHPDLLSEVSNSMRCIDVNEMSVIEVPRESRFVALSYLWGKDFAQFFSTSENIGKLAVPGGLAKEKVPKTIKDAILFTKMIGERYLWTDSLCLLHDDGFKYHDDWIYARAVLTVVAGSGKDANAGLPGVRKESRTFHQSIEQVKPGLRLMVSHLAEDYISTSQWDSRAWTFQERMLSRRCLLFVNGRIYFQCRRTTFCEDMEAADDNGWSLDSIDMPTRIFSCKPFVQFTSAVELYTQREMTNHNDILNAFEEVQRVLEKRLKTPIFYGVFGTMVDASLLWESTKKLVKRPGFPSWSWSGWIGEIQWKFTEIPDSWIQWDTPKHHGEYEFPAQQAARISPPIPWHKHSKRVPRQLTSTAAPLLHFSTVTAIFELVRPSLIHKAVISPLRKRLTGPSALSTVRPAPTDPGLIRAGIADRDGKWCGTIDLDEIYISKMGQPFEFLIMSQVTSFTEDEMHDWEGQLPDDLEALVKTHDYGVYNVLLVRNIRGIYFREGLGRILKSAVERAWAPGPEWKDILLA